MGFNLVDIISKRVSVQEQNSYDLVFVPPRSTNVETYGFTSGFFAQLLAGMRMYVSSSQGHWIKFRFSGKRIGVLFERSKSSGLQTGIVGIDIDGVDYGVFDTSQVTSEGTVDLYNVPTIIATDLDDGEHIIKITKLDTNAVAVCGYLVDNASNAQTFTRTVVNYHEMLDTTAPVSIGTSLTTVRNTDTWLHGATFTNTTGSAINVTLQNNAGTVIAGPFSIPANDIRQINGPLYFASAMKAIASATGVTIAIGGQ